MIRGIRLLRRRTILLPTIWGWLALALLAVAAFAIVSRELHPYLAPTEPVKARLLVVEGWLSPTSLDQAAEAIRAGSYERVATTGGPIDSVPEFCPYTTWAQRATDFLRKRGVADSMLVTVDAPASRQDRTFLSAVMVREWAKRSMPDLSSIDVFSYGVHARRTRMLYRLAFGPAVNVGIYAARPDSYEPDRWWRTSIGAEIVFAETVKLLWSACFFWPGPPGSHDEKWAEPSQRDLQKRRAEGK